MNSFLGQLRKHIGQAVQWLPKAALKPMQIQPSETTGQVLTTTANGTEWAASTGGGGGGVTDHGALTGLADDDHPQYHTDARGDARYVNITGDTMTGVLDISTGANADTLRLRDATNTYYGLVASSAGRLDLTQAASSALALRSGVNGEASYRFVANADGSMEWGGGAASRDVVLSRTNANELSLATGDVLRMDTVAVSDNSTKLATTAAVTTALGAYLTTSAAASTYLALAGGTMTGSITASLPTAGTPYVAKVAADTQNRFSIDQVAASSTHLGTELVWRHPTTASQTAKLYGKSNGVLYTPSQFEVGTTLSATNITLPTSGSITFAASNSEINFNGAVNRLNFDELLSGGAVQFLRARNSADTTYRLAMELDSTSRPALIMGPGGSAATDWEMRRTAANEVTIGAGDVLRMDTAAEGSASTVLATTAYADRAAGNQSSARPACRASRSTSQSIPGSAWTSLSWTAEDFDNDSMFTLSSPTRITATANGQLLLTGATNFTAAAGAQRYCRILKNGTTAFFGSSAPGTTAEHAHLVATLIDNAVIGDYYEFQVVQYTGAAINAFGNGAGYFSASWVGGTGAAWGNAGARATAGAFTAANGAFATFSNEEFDHDGSYDPATPNRLTCKTAGTFEVKAHLQNNHTGGSYRRIHVVKNGTITLAQRTTTLLSAGTDIELNFDVQLAVGDYIQLQVGTDSAGNSWSAAGLSMLRVGYQTNPAPTSTIPQAWTSISTFATGWSAAAIGGYQDGSYMRDAFGMVQLRGLIKKAAGAGGQSMFTLPAGFRPPSNLIFTVSGSIGGGEHLCTIYLLSDGTVSLNTYTTPTASNVVVSAAESVGWVSLANISFSTAA